jgi:hypothetical protein
MAKIILTNTAGSRLALDFRVGPVAIRNTLENNESIDIGHEVSVDEVSACQIVQDMLSSGKITITTDPEATDITERFITEGISDITVAVTLGGNDNDIERPARITSGDWSAYPFRNIQTAIDALPKQSPYTINVNVGAGDFNGYTVDGFTTKSLNITGTRTTFTPTTGPSSGTATGGARHTLTLTAAGWTTGDLAAKFLRIISGAGAGQILVIGWNDVENIYLADPCAPLLAAGSVFVIETNTRINMASQRITGMWSNGVAGIFSCNNRGVTHTTDFTIDIASSNSVSTGWHGERNTHSQLTRVVSIGDVYYSIWEASSSSIAFNQIAGNNGKVGISLFYILNAVDYARGWAAVDNDWYGSWIQHSFGSVLTGMYTRGSGIGWNFIYSGFADMRNVLCDTVGYGIALQYMIGAIMIRGITINNATNQCIVTYYTQLLLASYVTGTGNTKWGIKATGTNNLVDLYVTPTLTGDSGDLTLDGTTNIPWSDLTDINDYSVNLATGSRAYRTA